MLDPIPDPLTNEAADEIERLRQQRDEYANEITGKLMPEIERLRGLSDITRLDVMWQELVKERYAAENNAAILAKEVQNLRAEIKQLRGQADLLARNFNHCMDESARLRGLLRETLWCIGIASEPAFCDPDIVAKAEPLYKRVREALGE